MYRHNGKVVSFRKISNKGGDEKDYITTYDSYSKNAPDRPLEITETKTYAEVDVKTTVASWGKAGEGFRGPGVKGMYTGFGPQAIESVSNPVEWILGLGPGALKSMGNGSALLAKSVTGLADDAAVATAKTGAGLVDDAAGVLSKGDYLRIQNAATRINKPITVVGSRAKGTAGAYSDWDYVIQGLNNNSWKKIKNSLPGSRSVLDNTPRNIDIFKTLDPTKPHIIINPR